MIPSSLRTIALEGSVHGQSCKPSRKGYNQGQVFSVHIWVTKVHWDCPARQRGFWTYHMWWCHISGTQRHSVLLHEQISSPILTGIWWKQDMVPATNQTTIGQQTREVAQKHKSISLFFLHVHRNVL